MAVDSVGRELKILTNKMNRRADAMILSSAHDQVTEVQARVLGFLHQNRTRDVFQRDVEAEFSITRATASKMLSLMERNGLISRCGVVQDARLKKLTLTEKAMTNMRRIWQGMRSFEALLTQGMTEAERHELLRLLRMVEKNVE